MIHTYKGAIYKKTDLQLHSPRDRNWVGRRPEVGCRLPSEVEAARRIWANNFIDKCLQEGVQVAALTDHHEGIYCWYVIEELNNRNNSTSNSIDLWVIPGMELTCKDSAQALILFDANISRALFEKSRSLLRLPVECYASEQQGIEVELLDYNIEDIQGVLEDDLELRGRFIILPNVTPGGHKTVLRAGFHKRFKDLPYIGGYLDKKYPNDLEERDRRILEGQIPAWTSERRGIIGTSDARSADFSALGSFATWVKLAEPTAESLRQAMLAADSRIQYKSLEKPALFVKSVSVKGAEFLSLDQPVNISHQFTSIIGGRGSGKSTLLEYIRFAIGQSAIDIGDSNWDPTHERRKSILKHSLNERAGIVEVVIEKDGASISLTRSRLSQDRIIMRVQEVEKIISPSDARKLFSFQAYSQGELSHLGDEKAEKRLFDLITDPQKEAINQIEKNQQAIASDLRELLEQAVKGWQYEKEQRKLKAQLLTLEAGIDSFKQKLSSLPTETQKVLEQHKIISATSRWFEQVMKEYQTSFDNLTSSLEKHLELSEERLTGDKIPTSFAAQELAIALRNQMNSTEESFRELVKTNQEYELEQTKIILEWNKVQNEHNAQYDLAINQLSQHKANLEHLRNLESQRDNVRFNLDELNEKIKENKGSYIQLIEKGGQYMALQKELRKTSQAGTNLLAELTDNLARAELSDKDDLSQLESAIKELFGSTGVRTDRLENLLADIASGDAISDWWRLMSEVISILRWNVTGLRETEQRPVLKLLDGAIDRGGLDKFCERLNVERVSHAITAVVRPRIRLLQKRENSEIEFSQASQGEKATILLNVLIRQEGGPLLLDQPEEDLDNRIIGDIVSATRQAKNKKQLLFATHNANLVVNGDAELVIDLAAGQINMMGAIDFEDMRVAITDTMEGGKDAFELRRKKYNF